MNQSIQNIIDRYLYPHQIIFGHLFNPNIKLSHQYQFNKSNPQQPTYDQLIIYQKNMSNIKIQSMLNMMEGKHQPLFKSSVLPKTTHLSLHQNQNGQESFEQQEDDYQDHDDQMYLMQKDYEEYFDNQYDQQENPIMALGHSLSNMPKINNYSRQYNLQSDILNNKKSVNSKLFMSQQAPNYVNNQQGLGNMLELESKIKQKGNKLDNKSKLNKSKLNQKKQQKDGQNNSDEDWQTQSQEQGDQDVNQYKRQK